MHSPISVMLQCRMFAMKSHIILTPNIKNCSFGIQVEELGLVKNYPNRPCRPIPNKKSCFSLNEIAVIK